MGGGGEDDFSADNAAASNRPSQPRSSDLSRAGVVERNDGPFSPLGRVTGIQWVSQIRRASAAMARRIVFR
jgi:hypothetical protein